MDTIEEKQKFKDSWSVYSVFLLSLVAGVFKQNVILCFIFAVVGFVAFLFYKKKVDEKKAAMNLERTFQQERLKRKMMK